MKIKLSKDFVTLEKAAEILDISKDSVKHKIYCGDLIYIKLGNIYYVSKKSILYFLRYKHILNKS